MPIITRREAMVAGTAMAAAGLVGLGGVTPAAADKVSYDAFKMIVVDFVDKQAKRIQDASNARGGWEKWLQTELAMEIMRAHARNNTPPQFEREVGGVYVNDADSVDFLCNGPTRDNPNANVTRDTYLVELKCGSTYTPNLKAELEKDLKKLSNLTSLYANARRYSYVVVVMQESLRYMNAVRGGNYALERPAATERAKSESKEGVLAELYVMEIKG